MVNNDERVYNEIMYEQIWLGSVERIANTRVSKIDDGES